MKYIDQPTQPPSNHLLQGVPREMWGKVFTRLPPTLVGQLEYVYRCRFCGVYALQFPKVTGGAGQPQYMHPNSGPDLRGEGDYPAVVRWGHVIHQGHICRAQPHVMSALLEFDGNGWYVSDGRQAFLNSSHHPCGEIGPFTCEQTP